jgi:hypothetical protein
VKKTYYREPNIAESFLAFGKMKHFDNSPLIGLEKCGFKNVIFLFDYSEKWHTLWKTIIFEEYFVLKT